MKQPKQIEIHAATQFFYTRTDSAKGIVVLTNDPQRVVEQYPETIPLFIFSDPHVFRKFRMRFKASAPNTYFASSLTLRSIFLEDKLLVCVDYLEVAGGLPKFICKWWVARYAQRALISLTSVHENNNWQINNLCSLLAANSTLLTGKTRRFISSHNEQRLVALSGGLIDVQRHAIPSVSLLAILHVFNERDVIASTIKHLTDQGAAVHVIDNWSTDDTYTIIKSLAESSANITYERFPAKPNNAFELGKMLTRVVAVAREKKQFDWIMLNDADEIRWSPWKDVTLQQAISFVDSLGFNAIDYTVFNFVPTREGFDRTQDLIDFFDYGEFSSISGHFVQIKTWRNIAGAELAPSGGHRAEFPNQKVFPLKFLLGHYPIRSTKHGLSKIFKERKARYSRTERRKGWHVHYDHLTKHTSFLGSKKQLINFKDDAFDETYLLERVSGIGIRRKKD